MPHRSRSQALNKPTAHRFNVNVNVVATLMFGWAAASLAAFAIVDTQSVLDVPSVLDMHVGALLAGQGGLMVAVLIGVRLRDRKR